MLDLFEFFRGTFFYANCVFIFLLFLFLPYFFFKWYKQSSVIPNANKETARYQEQMCWCIVVFLVLINWVVSLLVDRFILSLDLHYLERRRLFYIVKMSVSMLVATSLFALHKLSRIKICFTSKILAYFMLSNLTICFAQFVLRGYEITEKFSIVYFFIAMFTQTLVHFYYICFPFKKFLSKEVKVPI